MKVSRAGGGYVDYTWAKPGTGSDKPVQKTAYAVGYAPWGWVVTTGAYMNDIQKQALIGIVIFDGELVFIRHIKNAIPHPETACTGVLGGQNQ